MSRIGQSGSAEFDGRPSNRNYLNTTNCNIIGELNIPRPPVLRNIQSLNSKFSHSFSAVLLVLVSQRINFWARLPPIDNFFTNIVNSFSMFM